MKQYEAPIISISPVDSEGIYLASGNGSVSYTPLQVTNNWGTSGQGSFTVDLSSLSSRSQLTIDVDFNMNIYTGWGDGSNASTNGSRVSYSWYSAPAIATLYVEVREADITQLKITGIS